MRQSLFRQDDDQHFERHSLLHASLIAVAAAIAIIAAAPSAAPSGSSLSVAGSGFQVDGRSAFLLGVSLFDAVGSTPPRDQDLDTLKGWGVRVVRVWAHWHEPIYQGDGALTAEGRTRLLRLVERLRARGLILELVLLRPGQLPGQPYHVFASEDARLRSVEAVTSALREYRNVLFDLYNEHDHPDGPISHASARALRDKVKAVDPDRIVTISSTEGHLVGAHAERNVREEAGTDGASVGVDVVSPHFPRTDDWSAQTGARIAAVRSALDAIGRRVPIYLNEERRANETASVAPDAYHRAYTQAQQAGAAGWVFHTAAGFELRKRPFIDALGAQERAGLEGFKRFP